MTNLWWTTALLTGLAGSLHCLGMCGPLAMALPVGRLPLGQRQLGRGVYHLGRISAYSLLGAVVGTVGQGFLLTGLQRPLSITAGVLLLIWTLSARSFPTSPLARRLAGPLAKLLRQPTLRHLAGLGFLNGLLPCGSVYVALVGALATSSPWAGAGYLFVFGLGTLPAMLGLIGMADRLTANWRQRLSRGLPWATLLVAVLLIVRGIDWQAMRHPASQEASSIPLCHGKP